MGVPRYVRGAPVPHHCLQSKTHDINRQLKKTIEIFVFNTVKLLKSEILVNPKTGFNKLSLKNMHQKLI